MKGVDREEPGIPGHAGLSGGVTGAPARSLRLGGADLPPPGMSGMSTPRSWGSGIAWVSGRAGVQGRPLG
jgi:hypothetical protein